eukprot:TRINITY_DN13053_c0_g1_i1.p1 TRINITY_DN13053_c0_g1~~TRINITY_DN13053_c0_g1_i1.p1  ORF type:complete len:432 (-),score=90.90 TRINITY_DN13053_c0_g1_i1:242-1537(-)
MSGFFKAISGIFSPKKEPDPVESVPRDTPKHKDLVIKILVVGDTASGKSSLIQRYNRNIFLKEHVPTIGPEFYVSHAITARASHYQLSLRVHFLELPLVELQGPHLPLHCVDLAGAIIVFDLAGRESIQGVDAWRSAFAQDPQLRGMPIMVVGNKKDSATPILTAPDMDKYVSSSTDSVQWRFVSAATGDGVREAIDTLVAVAVPRIRRRMRQITHQTKPVEVQPRKRAPVTESAELLADSLREVALQLYMTIRRDLSSLMNVVNTDRREDITALVEQCSTEQSSLDDTLTAAMSRTPADIPVLQNLRSELTQSAVRWESVVRELLTELASVYPMVGDTAEVRHAYQSITTFPTIQQQRDVAGSFQSMNSDAAAYADDASDVSSESRSSVSRTISAISHHTAASNATSASRHSVRSGVSLPRLRVPLKLQT